DGLVLVRCRLLGRVGDDVFQGEQGANHLDVGRDLTERLRLKEKLFEALLFNRVLLDDRDDVLTEVAANVAEPLGQTRSRRAQAGAALLGRVPLSLAAAVNLAEGFIKVGLLAIEQTAPGGKLTQPLIGGAA